MMQEKMEPWKMLSKTAQAQVAIFLCQPQLKRVSKMQAKHKLQQMFQLLQKAMKVKVDF